MYFAPNIEIRMEVIFLGFIFPTNHEKNSIMNSSPKSLSFKVSF